MSEHIFLVYFYKNYEHGSPELLVSTNDSRIRLCTISNFDLKCKYKGHTNIDSHVFARFSADGKLVISASEDNHIYVWRVERSIIDENAAILIKPKQGRNKFYECFKSHHGKNHNNNNHNHNNNHQLVQCALFSPNRTIYYTHKFRTQFNPFIHCHNEEEISDDKQDEDAEEAQEAPEEDDDNNDNDENAVNANVNVNAKGKVDGQIMTHNNNNNKQSVGWIDSTTSAASQSVGYEYESATSANTHISNNHNNHNSISSGMMETVPETPMKGHHISRVRRVYNNEEKILHMIVTADMQGHIQVYTNHCQDEDYHYPVSQSQQQQQQSEYQKYDDKTRNRAKSKR